MDPQFLSLATALEVPQEVADFLARNGILDCVSYALLSPSELNLKEDLIEMLKSSGVKINSLQESVAIKKLWIACRKHMTAPGTTPGGTDSEGLSKETELDLKKRWFSVHGFVLPDNWLLTNQLQKKLWIAASSSPPILEPILMECLRLLSQRSRASGTSVNVVPGQAVSATTGDIDVLPNSMEVFTRARAWFVTLAFVSIRNPKWFDLQTALFAAEKVLELVQCTSGGVAPPLAHFIGARAATVNYFSEQARITGESVIVFVKNTGSWEHRWTWTALATQSPSASGGSDLPRNVAMDVESMQAQARYWQAVADRDRGRNEAKAKAKGKGKPNHKGKGKAANLTPRERSRVRYERK